MGTWGMFGKRSAFAYCCDIVVVGTDIKFWRKICVVCIDEVGVVGLATFDADDTGDDADDETTTTLGAVIDDVDVVIPPMFAELLVAKFNASYWVDPGDDVVNKIGFAYPCCCCCCWCCISCCWNATSFGMGKLVLAAPAMFVCFGVLGFLLRGVVPWPRFPPLPDVAFLPTGPLGGGIPWKWDGGVCKGAVCTGRVGLFKCQPRKATIGLNLKITKNICNVCAPFTYEKYKKIKHCLII